MVACVAQGDLVSHLQIHMHAAHKAGATPEEIMEVLDLVGGWTGSVNRRGRRRSEAFGTVCTTSLRLWAVQRLSNGTTTTRRLPRMVKIFELAFLREHTPLPSLALRLVFCTPLTHTHRQYGRYRLR